MITILVSRNQWLQRKLTARQTARKDDPAIRAAGAVKLYSFFKDSPARAKTLFATRSILNSLQSKYATWSNLPTARVSLIWSLASAKSTSKVR